MKDNKLVCCVRLNGRIGYFYSCQHTFTDVFKTHRALKKAHKPCDCGGGSLTWNAIKANKANDRYSKLKGKDLVMSPKFWGGDESVYNKNPVLFSEAVSGVEETWYEEAKQYLMDDDLIELKRLFGQI